MRWCEVCGVVCGRFVAILNSYSFGHHGGLWNDMTL